MNNIEKVPSLIKKLYKIVAELETLFPNSRFTPDGHLVGSIGEVLSAHYYNLQLLPPGQETHDAVSRDGRKVQIKATQVKSIGISSEPDYLIVIKILPNGQHEEIYNGPGHLAWSNAGKMQKNGQRPIGLTKLSKLMEKVPESERI